MSRARWKLVLAAGAVGALLVPTPSPTPTLGARYAGAPTDGVATANSILSFMQYEWAGYSGQNVVNSVATSAAELKVLYEACNPDGVSWYRFGLGGGTAAGWAPASEPVINGAKDFGNGGCIIEPEAGQDPQIAVRWDFSAGGRKIHFRGGTWVARAANPTNWVFGASNNAYPGPASLLILKFTGNKIGCMFRAGEPVTNNANWPFVGIAITRAEQIIIDGNEFYGVNNAVALNSCRYARRDNNVYGQIPGDCNKNHPHGNVANAYPAGTFTSGPWTANEVIDIARNNLIWRGWEGVTDYPKTNDPSGDPPHSDGYVQLNSDNLIGRGAKYRGFLEDNIIIDAREGYIANSLYGGAGPRNLTASTGGFILTAQNTPAEVVMGFNIGLCFQSYGVIFGGGSGNKIWLLQNVNSTPNNGPTVAIANWLRPQNRFYDQADVVTWNEAGFGDFRDASHVGSFTQTGYKSHNTYGSADASSRPDAVFRGPFFLRTDMATFSPDGIWSYACDATGATMTANQVRARLRSIFTAIGASTAWGWLNSDGSKPAVA